MKNLLLIMLMFSVTFAFSQNDIKPKFEKQGNQTEATFYHDNGEIAQQGFFNKNNKLQGVWTSYDLKGNKTAVGNYDNGNKVGKWFFWTKETLKEVDYSKNAITSVNDWKSDTKLAGSQRP